MNDIINHLIHLFDMGRHTPYVWSSVAICFIVYLSLWIFNKIKRQQLLNRVVKKLQREQRIAQSRQQEDTL